MPHKRPFPRICIALGLADPAKLLEHARREADSGETFFEFRLDYLENPESGIKVIREILKQHSDCIILATCRRHQNHGKFNGSVEEQLHILDLATAVDAALKAIDAKDIEALAGDWYRDLVATHEDDPGGVDGWGVYQDFLYEGLAYFNPEGDGIEREPYDPRQGIRTLSKHFNIDEFLVTRGLNLDQPSRTRLVERVAWALVQGAETLKRRADGDYGTDEIVENVYLDTVEATTVDLMNFVLDPSMSLSEARFRSIIATKQKNPITTPIRLHARMFGLIVAAKMSEKPADVPINVASKVSTATMPYGRCSAGR
jgi:hypothetical protein